MTQPSGAGVLCVSIVSDSGRILDTHDLYELVAVFVFQVFLADSRCRRRDSNARHKAYEAVGIVRFPR